jgi:hypothetical protein
MPLYISYVKPPTVRSSQTANHWHIHIFTVLVARFIFSLLVQSPHCPPIKFWIPESIIMIRSIEPISTAYFINPSRHCMCFICMPPFRVRYRLAKHVLVEMNACNRRIVGPVVFYAVLVITKPCMWGFLCSQIIARYQLSEEISAATKNCWRHHFLCGPFLSKEN